MLIFFWPKKLGMDIGAHSDTNVVVTVFMSLVMSLNRIKYREGRMQSLSSPFIH